MLGFQGLEEEGDGMAVCGQLGGSRPEPTVVHLLQQRSPEASTAGCTDGPVFLYQPVAGADSNQELTPHQACLCCRHFHTRRRRASSPALF